MFKNMVKNLVKSFAQNFAKIFAWKLCLKFGWVVHHKDEPEGKSLHWAFVSKGINHLVVSQNCKSKTGYSSFQSVLFTTSFSRMKILVCFGP